MRKLFLLSLLVLPLAGSTQAISTVTRPAGADSAKPGTVAAAEVLSYAEEMPTFTGGPAALHRYLVANLAYPPEALKHNLSGTVVVQYVVDEQGRVVDVTVVRTSDPVFDAEAKRVIYMMPWWTPGREHGQPVRVRCTLPIIFTYKRTS